MEKGHSNNNWNKLLLLALGALGVVYGDIGTSPLYSVNEIFFGHSQTVLSRSNILGAISLVFWALTIVISFKYIIYVMRADNENEGGVFALYNLLVKNKKSGRLFGIGGLLIFASGLLFGDGMITPAISVISAVEGLKIATNAFIPYIVPITLVILTGLFTIQKYGTHKVGRIFGPIVIVWFVLIASLGLNQIVRTPQILAVLNPYYAFYFIFHTPIHKLFLVLGSVMLVVTGGEALYADMGHFGKNSIRLSWFSVVYPALILNYLGQGAYLLGGSKVIEENIFYSMTPNVILLPTIIIATLATIIASQALISGAFSLASQAIYLGLLPRLLITHTHEEHEGQIYIPAINWLIFAGCVFFVVVFKTSANLASAYGLAVSGVMFITTLSMMGVARYIWHWQRIKTLLVFLPLTLIDLSFLFANSLKFISGGFIPLIIALGFYILMKTWQWGRLEIRKIYEKYSSMTVKDLIDIKKKSSTFLPRSIIIMTPFKINSLNDKIPPVKQIFWERYGMLPQNLLFLTVKTLKRPYATKQRYEVNHFYDNKLKGKITNVILNYGFMEEPDIEKTLHNLDTKKIIDIEDNPKDWLIHISRAKILFPQNAGVIKSVKLNLLDLMFRLFNMSDYYFGLGNKIKLSIEIVPVQI
jgi:KUP system potassium uptake protein